MNILLINHYAGTPSLGMEFRPYYLAREWVGRGHRVCIVASAQSHYRARQPLPGREMIDGIEYLWLPTPAYQGNGWGRMRNITSFLAQILSRAPELLQTIRPDAVIASSTYPMDNWVAHRIAKQVHARFIYEVHDLWPLSPIELSGMSPWHPFALICQSAEDYAYRHADAVVSMLPKVHEHMARRGLDLKKLHVIPNGINPAEWDASARAVPMREDLSVAIDTARRQGAAVVGYAGTMGVPNALEFLMESARLMRDEAVHFVLVGDGMERAKLTAYVQSQALHKVHLLSPIEKSHIPAFLAAVDVAYIGWRRSPIYRFGIAPNKLLDYMMAARVVLHSVEAGNDPVGEAGCGVTVSPEDPQAIAVGLRQLIGLTPQQRRALGERGRAWVRQHHSYPVLAQRFLQALEKA